MYKETFQKKPLGGGNGISVSVSCGKSSSQGHGKTVICHSLNMLYTRLLNNERISFSIASKLASESNTVICKSSIWSCVMWEGISP